MTELDRNISVGLASGYTDLLVAWNTLFNGNVDAVNNELRARSIAASAHGGSVPLLSELSVQSVKEKKAAVQSARGLSLPPSYDFSFVKRIGEEVRQLRQKTLMQRDVVQLVCEEVTTRKSIQCEWQEELAGNNGGAFAAIMGLLAETKDAALRAAIDDIVQAEQTARIAIVVELRDFLKFAWEKGPVWQKEAEARAQARVAAERDAELQTQQLRELERDAAKRAYNEQLRAQQQQADERDRQMRQLSVEEEQIKRRLKAKRESEDYQRARALEQAIAAEEEAKRKAQEAKDQELSVLLQREEELRARMVERQEAAKAAEKREKEERRRAYESVLAEEQLLKAKLEQKEALARAAKEEAERAAEAERKMRYESVLAEEELLKEKLKRREEQRLRKEREEKDAAYAALLQREYEVKQALEEKKRVEEERHREEQRFRDEQRLREARAAEEQRQQALEILKQEEETLRQRSAGRAVAAAQALQQSRMRTTAFDSPPMYDGISGPSAPPPHVVGRAHGISYASPPPSSAPSAAPSGYPSYQPGYYGSTGYPSHQPPSTMSYGGVPPQQPVYQQPQQQPQPQQQQQPAAYYDPNWSAVNQQQMYRQPPQQQYYQPQGH